MAIIKYSRPAYCLTIVIHRDGMSIRLSQMMELVSQADKEGITLAAMLSRELSPEEMDLAQQELVTRLSENYAKIEDFMAEIRIPSIDEVLYPREALHSFGNRDPLSASSDNGRAEQDAV